MKNKINIRVGKNSIPVSNVFLNALSVMKFGIKYGAETKKQIAALIREMMSEESRINTYAVHQKILLEVLPKTKRDIVLSEEK